MEKQTKFDNYPNNFVFKGLVIFLLGSIAYSLTLYVNTTLSNDYNNGFLLPLSVMSLFILLIASPSYILLGYLEFEDKDKNRVKDKLTEKELASFDSVLEEGRTLYGKDEDKSK